MPETKENISEVNTLSDQIQTDGFLLQTPRELFNRFNGTYRLPFTATSNDFDATNNYIRYAKALCKKNNVLIILPPSVYSNIETVALPKAKQTAMETAGLTEHDKGTSTSYPDLLLNVHSKKRVVYRRTDF